MEIYYTKAHEYTWSDWEYDEEHHWRLCIADYCLSDDLGQNESMELHQFTTLDNGDRVCKCGYTIKADDTINPGVDKEEEVPKDVKTGFGVTPGKRDRINDIEWGRTIGPDDGFDGSFYISVNIFPNTSQAFCP